MRRRYNHSGRNNKSVRNIAIGCSVMALLLVTGYSAFQTNLNINAKGTIRGYTVTFDANGGTVDVKNKRVEGGSNYGDLPTPIINGYTFKGWHGKNMLNVSKKEGNRNGLHYIVENETIHINGQNTKKDVAYGLMGYDISALYKELEQNKTYTFSSFGIYDSNVYSQINFYPNNSSDQDSIGGVKLKQENISFITPNNYDRFAQIFIGIKSTAETIDESFNLQLEEGNEPTTKWEPYFITSDTKVVQEKDHTLTAIWEENS